MFKLLDNPLKVLSNPLSALSEIEKVIKEIEQNINTLDKVLRGVDINTKPILINNKKDLVSMLEAFIHGKAGLEALKACYEYIMRNESCQFCRTAIASALAEYQHGNKDIAKEFIQELIKMYKE